MTERAVVYVYLQVEKRLLSGQVLLVLFEHQLDALADVLGDRHLGLVQLLERSSCSGVM